MGQQEIELVMGTLEAFNQREFDAVGTKYREDATIRYPQSGESIHGRDRLLGMLGAFEHPPRWTVTQARSMDGGVIVEAEADYGEGAVWKTVLLYEITNGLISNEVAYFGAPFDPADWRAPFVTIEKGRT